MSASLLKSEINNPWSSIVNRLGRIAYLLTSWTSPTSALIASPCPTSKRQDLFITAHQLAPAFTDFPGYQPVPKQYIIAEQPSLGLKSKPNPWAKGAKGRALAIAAAAGLKFAQSELHAKAGERLSLTFSNPDVLPHNWVLIAPGKLNAIGEAANKLIADPTALARHYVPESSDVLAFTDMTQPGSQFTIQFDAPKAPGRYPFLCTFPGHWLVMNGVMVVE